MRLKLAIRWQPLALGTLVLVGLAMRLYGLNWDQGNSFHPDERAILFHVTAISWPTSFKQFLDPINSPLNPHFFAYGSLPIYLLAWLGHLFIHTSPNPFTAFEYLGRFLSALFDSGTILLSACIGFMLTKDELPGSPYAWNVALLTAALVAFTPFQLQLSHFYAVDTMLLFFIMLTLLACVALVESERPMRWLIVVGVGYGLALATKFSAAPLAVPIAVAVLLRWYRRRGLWEVISFLSLIGIFTLLIFCLAMPYAVLDLPNFVKDISDQGSLVRGLLDLPYVRQFAGTTPYLYEAQNMLFWGLGLMLGLAALGGILWQLWRAWHFQAGLWLILLSWVFVYSIITGGFYVKFMRYMLPIYPALTLMAAVALLALGRYQWKLLTWRHASPASAGEAVLQTVVDVQVGMDEQSAMAAESQSAAQPVIERGDRGSWSAKVIRALQIALIILVLGGTMFQGLALLNVYSQPNTRVQASVWIYNSLKAGSVLTYEQWDDPLPATVPNYDPNTFSQFTYTNSSNQTNTGLDLYGDDTTEKARMLANMLTKVDAITMSTDRLDKSIPRLPARYPLTIHYYQLLFSGQLGFHLAAQFDNRPNLLGITLDDSGADESYSVFDHPTAHIFVRDTPFPYTEDQLFQKLLAGVRLPAQGAGLSGAQQSLMLTQSQIDAYQNSPPLGVQLPAGSISNLVPPLFWWLTILLLGMLAFPLVFLALRTLVDRGYLFAKLVGILLLAYFSWVMAALHALPFERFAIFLVLIILTLGSAVAFVFQRYTIISFVRQRWSTLMMIESIFTLAYLLFVIVRSYNPDLWHVYHGGEKPMELAFLNSILRSPYAPPQDPWFSGGYINYYYYGYIIFGTLIKLTGIASTTAFNLAIPTLFALTFSGALIVVYSLGRSLPLALLGGYFAALIGNFDGLSQFKGQLLALLARIPVPLFDYWRSSRVVDWTINEFPFWSFLFADLHPHVIDMPIVVCMLGVLAALMLEASGGRMGKPPVGMIHWPLWILAAFIMGTIACVNPWDMPVYAILLGIVLLFRRFLQRGQETKLALTCALALRVAATAVICSLGYLFYWPFYASYQQLYVNGIGTVPQGSAVSQYLIVFGFWLFLAASFFLVELYDWVFAKSRGSYAYMLLVIVALASCLILGIKILLAALLLLGTFLLISLLIDSRRSMNDNQEATVISMNVNDGAFNTGLVYVEVDASHAPAIILQHYNLVSSGEVTAASIMARGDEAAAVRVLTSGSRQAAPLSVVREEKVITDPALISRYYSYLLLLMGLAIGLGIELIYIRDFLDGGDWARMNTVFKFSIQIWLCMAIGGALAIQQIWRRLVAIRDVPGRLLPGRGSLLRQAWVVILTALIICCSIFLTEGTISRVQDHQMFAGAQPPATSANYTPTLDGMAFMRVWYPDDARAITWINEEISGSPVILEAAMPDSAYQWFNRVSVYTGLPDVLGWPDHVGEQRYDTQPLNRLTDIIDIYTTTNSGEALELLHYYHVRYIYVGSLERQTYAKDSSAGLDKFDQMVGSSLRVVYHLGSVTIYEVL